MKQKEKKEQEKNMSVTLVSAFISNGNRHRSTEEYITLGMELMKLPIPKVIFMEPHMIDKLAGSYDETYTRLQSTNRTELSLSQDETKQDLIMPSNLKNPNKDTLVYYRIINTKTHWVRRATKINPFDSTQFVWVDFGILHVFKGDIKRFQKSFRHIPNRVFPGVVRIAGIWDAAQPHFANGDFVNKPLWFFAGGVFGGDKEALLKFDKLCQGLLEQQLPVVTWEVNIWYQAYLTNPKLFNIYQSNHDPSILEHY